MISGSNTDNQTPRELGAEPENTEEMTLIEHLLELRTRVMWAAIAIAVSTGVLLIPTVGF